MRKWDLLHCVLVISSLYQVDGTIGSFTNQIHDFETTDELVFSFACQFLEISHLLEVSPYLSQSLIASLLVQLLQKWDVCLKFFVVVSNVYEGTKQARREDHLKGLTVFIDRVKESEATKTMKLKLVLNFEVFTGVFHVSFRVFSIKLWAVVHKNFPNYMRAVKSDFDVVCIV